MKQTQVFPATRTSLSDHNVCVNCHTPLSFVTLFFKFRHPSRHYPHGMSTSLNKKVQSSYSVQPCGCSSRA